MFKLLFGSFCESAVTVAMMSVIFKRDHFLETYLTFARRQALKLFDVVTCGVHVRAIISFFLLTRCNRSVCHIPNILRLSYWHGKGGKKHGAHGAFIYLNAGLTTLPLGAFLFLGAARS